MGHLHWALNLTPRAVFFWSAQLFASCTVTWIAPAVEPHGCVAISPQPHVGGGGCKRPYKAAGKQYSAQKNTEAVRRHSIWRMNASNYFSRLTIGPLDCPSAAGTKQRLGRSGPAQRTPRKTLRTARSANRAAATAAVPLSSALLSDIPGPRPGGRYVGEETQHCCAFVSVTTVYLQSTFGEQKTGRFPVLSGCGVLSRDCVARMPHESSWLAAHLLVKASWINDFLDKRKKVTNDRHCFCIHSHAWCCTGLSSCGSTTQDSRRVAADRHTPFFGLRGNTFLQMNEVWMHYEWT